MSRSVHPSVVVSASVTLLVLLTLNGCCTFKGWFGGLNYAVQVRRGGEDVQGQSTAVLLVWPATSEVEDQFREKEKFHEAVQLARNLENKDPGSGAYAHLGSFDMGAGDCSRGVDRDGRSLVRACTATKVLVFTSKTGAPVDLLIANTGSEFTGFIQIDLTPDDDIEVRVVSSIPKPSVN